MKKLLFSLFIFNMCLFACTSQHRNFESIGEVKNFAENKGYKVLFETDSTLTYLNSDTLFVYVLKYDITEKFTEDNIIFGDIVLDLNKLYPMDLKFEPLDKRIIENKNIFEILLSTPKILFGDHNFIFKLKNQDDMLGEVDVLYDFSLNYLPEYERFEPVLTRLEYDCGYVLDNDGLTFKKKIFKSQYPRGFIDSISDIISGSALQEKFNEGGLLITDISIDKNGNITSILPSNILFGYNGDVNIPITEYGDGKDLLQAIESSL